MGRRDNPFGMPVFIDKYTLWSYNIVIEHDHIGGHMKSITVTIAEGKRDFSKLIREAAEKDEEIVVTKRGKPTAVIVSYEEYQRTRRVEAHRKIMESRTAFLKAGVSADDVYRESREELERRG